MQVTVTERDENNIVTLTFETQPGRAKEAYSRTLKRLSQDFAVKGFRKGKAPTKMIEDQIGASAIRAETLNDKFINELLQEAFKTENLNVVHIPAIERIEFEDPEDKIIIEAKVELFPEVKLADFKNTKVTVKIPKVDVEKEINETLDRIRANYASYTESDAAAEMGDEIVFDFDGEFQKDDGSYEPKPGMKAEGFQSIIEPGRFIDNFLEQIVGMKKDEEKTIEVKFPEGYHDAELSGRNARFKIKLQKVAKAQKPEINDEFAKSLGLEDVKTLKDRITEEITKLSDANKRSLSLETLLGELLPKSDLKLSKLMIQRELDYELSMIQQQKSWSDDQLSDFIKTMDITKEEEEARKKLERSVFLTSLIKQENIEVNPDELQEAANNLQIPQDYDTSKIDYQRLFQNITVDLLNRKAVDFLIANTQIDYVEVDPAEIEHHVHGPNCNHAHH